MLPRLFILVLLLGIVMRVSAQEASVVNAGFNINLRAQPNLNATVLQVLEPYTPVTIVGRSPGDTWYQIRVDDTTGWVKAEFISVTTLNAPFIYDAQTAVPWDITPYITNVNENTRTIFQRGQLLGNRADVFSKIGDSITVSAFTLQPIGEGVFELGEYWYLRPMIEYYSQETARTGNSFNNTSLAATVGWNSEVLLNPEYADKRLCVQNESPLECEYRLTRPSIALIMVGTNDVGFFGKGAYKNNVSRIVAMSVSKGIIPVLTTIPPRIDRPELFERVLEFNQILRDLSQQYGVPLIDYHAVMMELPSYGLDLDGIHPNLPAKGYDGVTIFGENNLYSGYVLRNLTLLHALDAIWREVVVG
jgi:uncharacterized protein YraI